MKPNMETIKQKLWQMWDLQNDTLRVRNCISTEAFVSRSHPLKFLPPTEKQNVVNSCISTALFICTKVFFSILFGRKFASIFFVQVFVQVGN